MISRLARALALVLLLAGLGVTPAAAQGFAGASALPVITQAIDNSRLLPLLGQVRTEANARNDRGALPDGAPLPHLLLQLKRPPEQEQALQQLIDQLHDPNSANFHHWLSASDFGARFGLAAQDIQTVTSWLEQQGFQVNTVYPNGTLIDFAATAGQIRASFHTELHQLEVGNETHFANIAPPQIPAALSAVVDGIVGLNDFKPHRQFHPRISYTASNGDHLLVPADLATIYNLTPLFSAGFSGQGQTVAVIEDTNVYSTTDWSKFRSTFGLSSYTGGSFTQVHPAPPSGRSNCSNPGTNADDGEAILDAEWAAAAAPSAHILLASCSNNPDGLLVAIQNLVNGTAPPSIISVSYGECEALDTNTSSYNAAYQQAVAEGISVFVASGDWGAAVCDASGSPPPAATKGIGVNALASSPYAVAVGGTDFEDVVNGNSASYWNATNTATYGSARSYVPEIPWNDSCASTLIAQFVGGSSLTYGSSGFCNSTTAKNDGLINIIGGSGGPSKVFAKPAWQTGIAGNQADGMRDLPDVSLFAGNGIWGHYYVFCWSDPGQKSNGAAACTGAPSAWSGAGGTSFAAPILAGIQALVNQKNGGAQGNPSPVYYALAKSEFGASGNASCNASAAGGSASSCIFYDVTQGDDDVPCTGSSSCYLPSGTYGVLSTSNGAYAPAFIASAGWDFASGIGSINAANLVNGWKLQLTVTVSGSGSGTVTSAPSGINCGSTCSASFVAGQQVTLSAAPAAGSSFTGWSGGCSGTGSCVVTISAATTVTASFASSQQTVAVSVTVNGGGVVTSSPSGLQCGNGATTCSANFASGTSLQLIATPSSNWDFFSWQGASCSGGGPMNGASTCAFTVSGALSETATFGGTISVQVSGSGTVTSDAPQQVTASPISCPGTLCQQSFPAGQQVAFTATPASGWMLSAWGGACSGSGSCAIPVNGNASLTATFVSTGGQGGAGSSLWSYTCTGTSADDLGGALAGTAPWSSTTSAAASGGIGQPASGDLVEITNMCLGDIVLATNNLTIANHDDSSAAGSDGVIGQVELPGVTGITLRNLAIEPPSGGFTAGTSNFTGAEAAMVYLHDGAAGALQGDIVHSGPLDGVSLRSNSSAVILDTTIGSSGTTTSAANGVIATDGSTVILGRADGSHGSTVSGNGSGVGVAVYRRSSAAIFASTLSDNHAGQVLADNHASLRLAGNQISQPSATGIALRVANGSSLIMDTLDNGTGNTVSGGGGAALYAGGGSSVITRSASLSSANAALPTIEISGVSAMILAGGNAVTNTASAGIANQIDHTSSFVQVTGPSLGYPNALADALTGSGLVELQSTVDLGQGFLPSTTTPSLTWSVPSGYCVLVDQNSSFRLSGGTKFSGAAPSACAANGNAVSNTIVIADESNIFVNTSHGGTNTITGGGSINCPFTDMPNAHITGAKNVSPNIAPTGSWNAARSASSPSCLGP